MRGAAVLALGILAAGVVAAPPAGAVLRVGTLGGIAVQADSVLGPDGDNGVRIGIRGGPVVEFEEDQPGRPDILAGNVNCGGSNDYRTCVVSGRPSLSILMGDGADTVVFRDEQQASIGIGVTPPVGLCIEEAQGFMSADVRLGDGPDFYDGGDPACGPGFVGFLALNATVRGEGGDDRITAGLGQPNVVFGGPGNDRISGTSLPGPRAPEQTLNGEQGNDVIAAGEGGDRVDGGPGNDELNGRGGPDSLVASDGEADVVIGGEGTDTVVYEAATGPVAVSIGNTSLGDGLVNENDDVLADVENISAGPFDDVLIGSTGPNEILGRGGGDVISGGAGSDDLSGMEGDDTLRGLEGLDSISPGAGRDIVDGGTNIDTVVYFSGPSPVAVNLADALPDGPVAEPDAPLRGIERVVGTRGDDVLVGDGSSNRLSGVLGRDRIDGGPAGDVLDGSFGDDILGANDGARDDVLCGQGFDTVTADLEDQPGADCESVTRFAVDDGPPASVRTRTVPRARTVRLTLACPRAAKVPCRGLLTVRSGARVLGGARYSVGLGRRSTLAVPLSARPPAGAALRVTGREKGASRKGPRDSVATLRVR